MQTSLDELKNGAAAALQAGNAAAAKALLLQAADAAPDDARVRMMLGNVHAQLSEHAEAEGAYRRALRLDPGLGEAHQFLGNLLSSFGRHEEAAECYRRALTIKPSSIPAHINLGNALVLLARYAEAREVYHSALHYDPACRKARLGIAHAFEREGNVEEAYHHLAPYLAPDSVDADSVMIFAALCRPLGRCDEAIALLEGLLQRDNPPLDRAQRSTVHYRLGKLYDARRDYDTAFQHFSRHNALKKQLWHFDPAAHERFVGDLIQTFSREFLARAPRGRADERPVFIVGMPRSGTTLVEQILASHPAVFGAGELDDMGRIAAAVSSLCTPANLPYPQCMEGFGPVACETLATRYLERLTTLGGGAARVTDKMPDNFIHLGLIALLFPGAHIIHCRRNPYDTALSCFFQNFGPGLSYTYDLGVLGAYHRQYARLMAHWLTVLDLPLLDVDYEDLVHNQEAVSRRMVAFCGLPWDDRCLSFHETGRAVITASYEQVRRPIYRDSIGRWRHYAAHLGALREALGESGDGHVEGAG